MPSIILPSWIFSLSETERIKNEGAEYLQGVLFFLSCYDDDATKLVEEASGLFSLMDWL